MMQNIQEHNVGNLGDIIKHSALVALAALLHQRNIGTNINYLDTHAFKIHARIPNADRWLTEIEKFRKSSQLCKEYIDFERPVVESEEYLCSSGLAAHALPGCRMFLAERDTKTRKELEAQLKSLDVNPVIITNDIHKLAKLDLSAYSGPLLALIDPFCETEEAWRETWLSASSIIRSLHKAGDDGVAIVFQYQKSSFPVWLAAPKGFDGPLAVANYKPYYLAAYGSKPIAGQVRSILASMGWVD